MHNNAADPCVRTIVVDTTRLLSRLLSVTRGETQPGHLEVPD